ncbi:MAG: hypothetical protein JW908_00130 [Anaerolineales bacterium]|nr:hypothetical protein [Anaerolineales bacterium]
MREWNLKTGDPLYLTIASDARLVPTDYCNDQIWELAIGGGDPSGIAIQTTFGLRARSFRMFPQFSENDFTISDPLHFISPTQIKEFYPNFLSVQYTPISDVDILAEYWIPHSHGLLIKITLTNQSDILREIKLEWITQLSASEGQNMTPVEMDNTWVLAGKSADIASVVIVSGGAQPSGSPYPSYSQTFKIPPHEKRFSMISQASFHTTLDSFTAARHFLGRSWESEINRVRLLNAGMVDIFTGDPDWDAAFAFSQNLLYQLVINPQKHLPFASFALSRNPDQGYSLRKDGLDYNHLWNGQPVLESYYLACALLPDAAGFAKGLVRNYLFTQKQNGDIDWKPGAAGQLSQLLATPILCSLTWRIYQYTSDKMFLEETFLPLYRFIKTWFSPLHDRDQDGIPEWDHIFQMGYEEHPIFSSNYSYSQGVDISSAECPALASLLVRECQCLLNIGKIIGCHDYDQDLESISNQLGEFVKSTWNDTRKVFMYRDRDTHRSTIGELLSEQIGGGVIHIQQTFEAPVRISIRIQAADEKTRKVQVFIHGISNTGEAVVDHIIANQMRWNQGTGILPGKRVYNQIEFIEIKGVDAQDTVTVFSNNYHFHDLTSFLPLWAGIPSAEQAQAMIQKSLSDPNQFFWSSRTYPPDDANSQNNDIPQTNFNLIWLQFVAEGMLRYGFHKEVARLFTQFMPAIIQSLKNTRSFREHYSTTTGKGTGEINIINGVAPIGLFLDTIGLRILSSNKIASREFNPFSWPVTVKYRGITIYKQIEKATVIFPNGETATIEDPSPTIVSLDNSVG